MEKPRKSSSPSDSQDSSRNPEIFPAITSELKSEWQPENILTLIQELQKLRELLKNRNGSANIAWGEVAAGLMTLVVTAELLYNRIIVEYTAGLFGFAGAGLFLNGINELIELYHSGNHRDLISRALTLETDLTELNAQASQNEFLAPQELTTYQIGFGESEAAKTILANDQPALIVLRQQLVTAEIKLKQVLTTDIQLSSAEKWSVLTDVDQALTQTEQAFDKFTDASAYLALVRKKLSQAGTTDFEAFNWVWVECVTELSLKLSAREHQFTQPQFKAFVTRLMAMAGQPSRDRQFRFLNILALEQEITAAAEHPENQFSKIT
ncbi:MAG TPA: hypothetical protein DEP87_02385 [Candidatus Pacebacteria bacterium]|nr:hypothetical protein [Candidatus Paceibacterota bacterium]